VRGILAENRRATSWVDASASIPGPLSNPARLNLPFSAVGQQRTSGAR
jgi:hypothetical protein